MSIFFTAHAIERFRERFAGGLAPSHALRELKVISASARRLREKTSGGERRLEAQDGSRMILVCKNDPRLGEVCVTILFGEEDDDPESDPLEAEA